MKPPIKGKPSVIRVGQTTATIYYAPTKGRAAYTVAWYEGANRKLKAFADFEAAKTHAQGMVDSLSKGEADILRLTGPDRLAYVRSREAIAEFNVAMDTAAIEYREAKRLLKGGSLIEAARYFAAHKLHTAVSKTVTEAVGEMLKSKEDEGLSERYQQDLDSRCGKFAKDFQCQLSDITGQQIREWIQGLDVANRTRNNFRLSIQTLFAFAKSRKYLPPDWNELDVVPLWKTTAEEVEIFTPAEMQTLFAVAPENMIPYLAIGAFAGLRSAEIERLDWSKVNLTTGYITVDAGIAKTNSRRLVPITDNLKAWLTPYAKKSGPVVELANIPNAIQRLVELTRPDEEGAVPAVTWKHNALRHSFCSYRLGTIKNAAQVALEAGNSAQMIFKHYRELVTEADALQWFALTPDTPANVIQVPSKAKVKAA